MWNTVAVILLATFSFIYFGLYYYYGYWRRKNIPHVPSHLFDFEWFHSSQPDLYANIYRRLNGHKFGGCYAKFTPQLMIRDPQLIKKILIKDFEYFYERGDITFDEREPLTMHLFSAPSALWRKLRPKLSPTFTSGNLKHMSGLVDECAAELCQVIGEHIETNNRIDMKDFSTRLMIDVISSCAFGLKANTIRDGNSIFKIMAMKVFARNFSARFVLITQCAFPWLKQVFRATLINKPSTEFFYRLTRDTINYRKVNSVKRNDFLQLLINMRDDDKQKQTTQGQNELVMTDELTTAQCFLFFLAGYETTSLSVSATVYELAARKDIQRKLQREIDEYLPKYNNKVTYEMLKDMPYLNQIILETLRKYPASGVINRICADRYRIPNTDVYIEKGTEVLIPLSGLHSDPEYFPNPEQYNPDRFEDLAQLPCRDAYIPFGGGPKFCIGSRFARMTISFAIVHLFRNFDFEWCAKTPPRLEFRRLKLVTWVKHDIVLKCSKRINHI